MHFGAGLAKSIREFWIFSFVVRIKESSFCFRKAPSSNYRISTVLKQEQYIAHSSILTDLFYLQEIHFQAVR